MSPGFLILIIVLFGLMWVVFIRPQKRKQVAQQQMLESIDAGTEIITAGGLFGIVRGIDEDELTVEIAPGTNVRLARRAVAAVIPPEEPDEAEEGESGEDDGALGEREPVAATSRQSGEEPS